MPIRKPKSVVEPVIKKPVSLPKPKESCCVSSCCGEFGKKILMTLLGILLVYLVFFLGTLINNNLKTNDYIGLADKTVKTISISGYGKVSGNNDIAVTTIGYSNINQDVSTAQSANSIVMNKILAELKKLGIDEKDLTSNYTIYPEYDYSSEDGRQFSGYRVSNQVTVKIRDLTKIQSVLALAGQYKANQISGLSFTIDDTENLKTQARAKALQDASKKAKTIASSLGLTIVSVQSYSEYEGGSVQPMYASFKEGLGGGGAVPDVASGSNSVETNVTVTYEVR